MPFQAVPRTLLIQNGRVVTDQASFLADLYVEDETISLIAPRLSLPADTVIDATGRLVLPGGIDPHTHLDLPAGAEGIVSSDDFFTGTRAAALGGTTTIIDFPTQQKGRSVFEALDTWHAKAQGKACIDYGFHMIITDLPEQRLADMSRLVREEGITSFKFFMAYPGVLYVDDGVLFRAMCRAAEEGALVMVHAENGMAISEIVRRALSQGRREPLWHARTRPALLEAEAVSRAITLAEIAHAPLYVVHTSCREALSPIAAARRRGLHVYGETCPQYLCLDDSLYSRPGFEAAKWVLTPPLRPRENQEPLWRALVDGDLQTVATDHCPFWMKDKRRGLQDFTRIPNGAPGIENRMSLVYSEGVHKRGISLERFVEITSTSAARIFGLYPRKGTLLVGSDADIVIFDPEREETLSVDNPQAHHMRVDYNAYEGMRVKGWPETVIQRGRVICDKGRFLGGAGQGQFLRRGRGEH